MKKTALAAFLILTGQAGAFQASGQAAAVEVVPSNSGQVAASHGITRMILLTFSLFVAAACQPGGGGSSATSAAAAAASEQSYGSGY